jgi:uncharacterized protein (TIGR03118 family)
MNALKDHASWSRAGRRPRRLVGRVEQLEGRALLSGGAVHAAVAKSRIVDQTNLVSDQAGKAAIRDPNLVNAWGIALPAGGNFWVSDNGSGKATVYNGDLPGNPLRVVPLVVTIPGGAPTGQVTNSTSDFQVSKGGSSGPALFIFATENGQISGWNFSVDAANAIVGATKAGAVYKGLAIASNGGANFLYAANFASGKIDVYDGHFHDVSRAGKFVDSQIPKGFAPFNVQALGGKLYVTYAKQDAAKHDDVAGAGNGFVDVFSTGGTLLQRLVKRGNLNSPWGLTIAPSTFGAFGGDLLVGNFGDGRINAYNPRTGALVGMLLNSKSKPLVIDGLWGLIVGNGTTAGRSTAVYFTAGPGHESHGLFGRLTSR